MIKLPPSTSIKSIQYDLFSQFITNNQKEVSNSVEMWDAIPKYFLTAKQQKQLRTSTGHADPYEWAYHYKSVGCMVKIQPALIKQNNGKYKAFFPNVTEELVEEALKKILTDQQYGIHDPTKAETWIKFSLSMVQKKLKARGRGRSIDEIKHAIEVMSRCNLTLYREGKEVWNGAILQDLVTVDRKAYKEDGGSLHAARLPLFISQAINCLDYRQHNHNRLMSCDNQLARWLLRTKLIPRFTQASLFTSYNILYSELKQSGLLQQAREIDNRLKVNKAFDELVKRDVLMQWSGTVHMNGRIIVDVKYEMSPSVKFSGEQKAANKRLNDGHSKAIRLGLVPVDK